MSYDLIPALDFHLKNNIPIAKVVIADLLQHEKVVYLKGITGQRCEMTPALFVPDRMYKVDSLLLDQFVQSGASPTIKRLNAVKKTKPFPYWYLGRIDDVIIPKYFAMKTAEQKCMIGGVNLSVIMYNESRTEADIVVDFQEYAHGELKLFYSVHLTKKTGVWEIVQKVFLING
ncbi:MAG: hypothetical protein Crog4KO_03360 [Crocinitomicaceae bacterium]